MMKLLGVLGLILLAVVVVWLIYNHNFKNIVTNCVCLLTGAPKTGKDLLQNDLAVLKYKRVHIVWWWLTKVFHQKREEPLFYCNYDFSFGCREVYFNSKNKIWRFFHGRTWKPHRLDKNIRKMTLKCLLREERFAFKSVCSITEATLVADNMLSVGKGEELQKLNTELTCFFKLFGHETHGGFIYLNTQNLQDVHYAVKRVCSSFFYIQKRKRFLWWDILYLREMVNSDMGAMNNFASDVDKTMLKYLVWRKRVYKRYDCYEFSKFTDHLPVADSVYNQNDGLTSFNKRYVEIADKRQRKEENKK